MRVKPSKKPKKRYIVFEVVSEELNDSAIHNAIKKSALNVLGANYPRAGIRFLKDKYKPRLHRGILRVNNEYSKKLIGAINKLHKIRTLGMSGILKKAEDKYLKIAS